MEIKMKKTKFLFDLPITKDWLFYVFLLFLGVNVLNGLSNVSSSGGISSSSGGIISGLIDGAMRVLLSWFPIVPIIYFIRKKVREKNNSNQ
jgi:hypothetical protein